MTTANQKNSTTKTTTISQFESLPRTIELQTSFSAPEVRPQSRIEGNVVWAVFSSVRTAGTVDADFDELEDFSDFASRLEKDSSAAISATARQSLAETAIVKARLSPIAQLRLKNGMSQAQLATSIGTSQPHIARLEADAGNAQLNTLSRLADALHIRVATLVELLTETNSK